MKKPYHHGDLRQTLLAEAARLIREEGEDALSMRRLAGCAGVSRTAAYYHFKDKTELLCAIAEEGFEKILAEFNRTNTELQGPLCEEQLNQFMGNYLRFAVKNPEFYNLMFGGQLWKSASVTESLTQKAHEFFRYYVSLLRQWQASGQISKSVDPVRLAQVTMSTLHGMSRLLIDGIYVEKSTIEAIGDSATRMLWRELQAI